VPCKTFHFEPDLQEVLSDLIGLYLGSTGLCEALRAIVAEAGGDLTAHDQAIYDLDQDFISILRSMELS